MSFILVQCIDSIEQRHVATTQRQLLQTAERAQLPQLLRRRGACVQLQ